MPTGLKLQFPEIHLMDSLSITQTRKKIADIHRQTEKSICTALIEHYTQVIQETKKQMDHVEKAISGHMHKGPRGTSHEHRRLLNKLERNEDSMEYNLQRKRDSKLNRLKPRARNTNSPRVYAHTSTQNPPRLYTPTNTPNPHTPSPHTHTSPRTHTPQTHRDRHTPERHWR